MDDAADPTKPAVPEDGLAAFIQQGLTEEALEALDNGADPNTTNADGQKVLCLAISCGNEVIVKRLLENGADISTETVDGADFRSTRAFKALITIPLTILQFYQPASILPIFRFAILALPVEWFIWSIVLGSHPIQMINLLRSIATLYFGLAVCSRYLGGILLKLSVGCLQSRSLLAYLARRLFLVFAFGLANPHVLDSIQHSPGVQATLALFKYEGEAETMAMHLLNHGLVLGDPNYEYSVFRSFWTWSIGRGYPRIGGFLLEKTSLRELVLKQDPQNILVTCSSNGHDGFLKLLLEEDAQAFKPKELSEALMACLTGHMGSDKMVAIVLLLLRYGADANATCSEGRSALSWACEYSVSHVLIQPLFDAGATASIASLDNNNQTALHHAAWRHYFHSQEGLEALVSAGAPLNAIDKFGHTPLWEAVSKGWPPFVAFFLECGAEVDCRGEGGTTPLMEACRHSNLISVAMLLAEGADPNACTENDTPLISACYRQYSEDRDDMVYMLLQAGAHPIMPLDFPRQPLVESVRCTRESGRWMHEILGAAQAAGPVPHEILDNAIRKALYDENSFAIYLDGLQTLIEAGGSPNTRLDPMYPGDGGAVIHYVCKSSVDFRGSTRDLIRFLVKCGASLSDRDKKGRTPLHVAVRAVNQTAVEELVSLNSPLDAEDDEGCTALALACKTKPTDRTGYTTLGHHPDLDGPEFSGKRLQVYRAAIISDRLEQVKRSMDIEDITHLLREAGANPIFPDNDGLTPLHLACKAGNPITAGVILQNRHRFQSSAQTGHSYSMRDLVGASDNKGKNPLHWAAQSGSVELVRMILAANSLLRFGFSDDVTHEMDKKYPSHFAFVSELLHAMDDKNYTPLHYAAEEGHKDVVKVFLEEVEALDISEIDRGVSVTSVAEARGHSEIVEMITVSRVKVSSEEWKQYQRRASFNEGDWCGLDCRWCAYQRGWMSA